MPTPEPLLRICPHCGSSCALEHQYCPACGFPVGTVGSSVDKFVGKTLPGGHHILDLISVGGMGRVYRAQQSALGRTVAVKIIHPHLLSDENSALRFMTEARAASQLNHPNSVAVFDFGRTEDGQPYLVMEFLRGKDLARVAHEEGPLSFGRIVDVLRQVLAALGEAHDLGIVHRDLKPENVILEPLRRGGDFVKVVDFGLAKLKADAQAPSNVTSPGIVCGTPDYMAPEQGRGDAIDGRSDLYSVGVMLFQLLTGRLPYEADSPTQVVMMHLTIPVPDPRQVAPERAIPEPLVAVVFRAMAKDSRDRYHDAAEFAEALRAALAIIESVPPSSTAWENRLSVQPAGIISCPACGLVVALTKFCGECGARLPIRSGAPEIVAAPVFPLPMVGREDELAWLDQLRKSAEGKLAALRIVGEPGAGKTRLLLELKARAEKEGDLVVVVGPDPYIADVPHYALKQALVQLSGKSPEQILTTSLNGVSPSVAQGIRDTFEEMPRFDGRSVEVRRRARADALAWAVELASRRSLSRVVLCLDELHRMDELSRSAFADFIGEPPKRSILVIGSHIPGFEPSWGGEAPARRLAGLAFGAVLLLLKMHPSGERVRIDESARGFLPLYVEQVLRYSIEGGSDPPRRLADLIALRVDTLAPNSRRALQVLSVVGEGASFGVLSELLQNPDGLDQTVDELRRAGMLMPDSSGNLTTSHPLLRDVVLAGLPAGVRRDLNQRTLAAAEKLKTPLEARAQHAYYARDSFQALLLLEQVAERATLRGDVESETLALRRGLELAREEISRGELDDPLRAVVIFSRKLGAALSRSGNYADAEGILREALDLTGPSGADRARVLSELAQVAHGRQRSKEAMGYIDQAIEVARQSGAHDLVATYSGTRQEWAS
jgi:serine/threonine-protein kinase